MAADELLIRMLTGEIVIMQKITKKSEVIQTSARAGHVRHVTFSHDNKNCCCETMYRFNFGSKSLNY